MPAPVLLLTDPVDTAQDVALNKIIVLTFDQVLDVASVTPQTVILKSLELNQIIDTAVTLDSTLRTIQITPAKTFIPQSSYLVTVPGADVSTTTITSGSLQLATTLQLTFQTGDQTETSLDEIAGDLNLPDDITTVIGGSVPLRIVGTTPRHNSFGFAADRGRLSFRFSKDIEPNSISENIEVEFDAMYGEDDLLAAEADLGDGSQHYFKRQTADYTGLDPTLFDFPEGSWSQSGNYLFYDYEGSLPKNTAITVEFGEYLQDTDGGYLGDGYVWFAVSEPYPDWVSSTAVRHEVGSVVTKSVPDSFIGMRIWQHSMDLVQQFDWHVNIAESNVYHRKLVRCMSALNIWEDLKAGQALMAGVSKTLGDLTIRSAATAGAVRPFGLTRIQDDCEKLRRQVWYWMTERPQIGIRGSRDPLEPSRGYFRERLWRAELVYNDVATPANVANTALERFQSAGVATIHRKY